MAGLLSIGFAQWLSQLMGVPSINDAADIAKIGSIQSTAVIQRYFQLRQDQEILSGSAMSFIVLAIRAISEIRNLLHLRKVICSGSGSHADGDGLLRFSII